MMEGKLGKIDSPFFHQILDGKWGASSQQVRTGPAFGVDVSVVEVSPGLGMAMTSDPLSLIPSLGLEESAWLSVHLLANDMATTGCKPQFGQFVLNLPPSLSKEDFKVYWDHIDRMCKSIGVSITGGHTGFIEGQKSTIAGGGTFISIAPFDRILLSERAREGDAILMTKTAALSSSAILGMSFPQTVEKKLGKEAVVRAREMFYETSSLKDGLISVEIEGAISAMHDVTEGGVYGAIYEMSEASGLGCVIDVESIPVDPVTSGICQLFDLEPEHCIGAGSMIMACSPSRVSEVIRHLSESEIACSQVGTFTEKSAGKKLVLDEGKKRDLIYQQDDPYWASFFNALKKGWN